MKLRKKIKKWFYIPLKPIYLTIDNYRFVCFIKQDASEIGITVLGTYVFSRDFKEPFFITYIDNILSRNKSKEDVRKSFQKPIRIVKRMK